MNETFEMVKRLYYSEAGAPIELKPGQLEIFNAIARKEQPRVQVKCFTRYGKSMTVALAALTRATSFPESWKIIAGTKEKAKIVMSYVNQHIFDNDYTASKFIFDKGETKEYIKRHRNKNHLTFRIGKDENGRDLYSDIKVLSAKDALGEGGQNVIEDEAALIPDVDHGFVMRMLGDYPDDNFLCKIGNPFTRGHFLKSELDPAYRKINIDCYQGLTEGRITQEIIEENRPYVYFPVLFENKFPDASEIDEQGWLYLLTEEDIKTSTERIVEPFGDRRLGVDVARGGRNFNVWVLRDNNTAKVLLKNLDNDLMSTAKTTMDFMRSEHVLEGEVYIDDTGVGGGVVDRMREAGAKVNGVILGAKSDDPDMANLRAEVYAGKEGLHNWVKRGGKLIPHADWEELTRIRYKKKFNGVQIEPKEDMRKRGESSPDVSDALALSFAKSSRVIYRGLPDPREILSKVNTPGINPAGGVGQHIPGIG